MNKKNDEQTLRYYTENADAFISSTAAVDFSIMQDRFIELLTLDGQAEMMLRQSAENKLVPTDQAAHIQQKHILDFGCGSGRDAKYFLQKGFRVSASDGSSDMCRAASEFAGISVTQMMFTELAAVEEYGGVWACSSILHLPKDTLRSVFTKIETALKTGGIFYTSFKYGTDEGMRAGRYFTDMTEETFSEFLSSFSTRLHIIETRISADVRPGRENEKWLNIFMKKI